MTDKPISPLRQRMIEDMTARRFAEKIQNDYIRYVKNFAAFLGRSPDAATAEDLRLFQLHMAKTHVSPWTINATIVALRFFFKVTLERDDLVRRLTLVREPRRAPTVLSPEEVARLLEAASDAKYKAALGVAYGAGLRVSEVVALKVSDIDNKRMLLRVEQGKGQKDRFVMLSPQLLELLSDWWQVARPRGWGRTFATSTRTRARPMTTARRITADAWPPGRGSTSVATSQARCSAVPRKARNVSMRDRAGPLHPARTRSATGDRPAPPDLAGAAAAQNSPPTAQGKRTRRSEDLLV